MNLLMILMAEKKNYIIEKKKTLNVKKDRV